ncbi:MAG: hypothetical protein WCG93_00015 [Paludibacter sp.]
MNLLNNNRFLKIISVLLLLGGFTFFAVQFFQHGEIEFLLCKEFGELRSNEALTLNGMESSYEHRMITETTNLPSYKNKKRRIFDDNDNSAIELPFNTNLETEHTSKKTITGTNSQTENSSNSANYNCSQNRSESTNRSGNQPISSNVTTFEANNNVQSINTGIQYDGNFGSKSQSFSNTSSNSFLANNTLTITSDLSENNSPMLIDGGTNPGDPGIPVGDGTWVLLGLLVGYGLVLSKPKTTVFKDK